MRKFLGKETRPAHVSTPLYFDEGNRACFAAIQRIAAGDVSLAMPIVIVGDSDTGKSRHLAELENLMIRRGRRVYGGTVAEWIRRYRLAGKERDYESLVRDIEEADLIIIDEFHRASSSPATMDFLLNRIQARCALGLATAIASRHAPRDIRKINDRATSLLLGGFLVYLSKPGATVRRRFSAHFAAGRAASEDLQRICEVTPGGLGALGRAVEQWVSRTAHAPVPPILLDRILVSVAAETGLTPADIVSRRRTKSSLRARQIFLLVSQKLGFGLASISNALDGRGRLALRRAETQATASGDASIVQIVDKIALRIHTETRGSDRAPKKHS
ncbi:MAG: ATP-binding protein [Planctomycetes bacterium]|nr:ATP-binding protein [Planctomycetota bacterium]